MSFTMCMDSTKYFFYAINIFFSGTRKCTKIVLRLLKLKTAIEWHFAKYLHRHPDDAPSGHNLSKQLAKPTLDSFAILDVSYFSWLLAFRVGLYFVGYLKVPDHGRRFSLPIGIQKSSDQLPLALAWRL